MNRKLVHFTSISQLMGIQIDLGIIIDFGLLILQVRTELLWAATQQTLTA
jgi:hypothetical protein